MSDSKMKKVYFEIYTLLEQLGNPLDRWKKIHQIVRQPDFQYRKEDGADFIISLFLKNSYWLDKELFDESYLYQKNNQNLLSAQNIHLEMVNIGASLLDKGFPLEYNPDEYSSLGPNQLGNYVQTFVKQCHHKYAVLHGENAKKKVNVLPQKLQNEKY